MKKLFVFVATVAAALAVTAAANAGCMATVGLSSMPKANHAAGTPWVVDNDTLASLALANLTAVVSFCLLAFSNIPALFAIGQIVAPGILLSLLLFALIGCGGAAPPLPAATVASELPPTEPPPAATALSDAFSTAAAAIRPCVVRIDVETSVPSARGARGAPSEGGNLPEFLERFFGPGASPTPPRSEQQRGTGGDRPRNC